MLFYYTREKIKNNLGGKMFRIYYLIMLKIIQTSMALKLNLILLNQEISELRKEVTFYENQPSVTTEQIDNLKNKVNLCKTKFMGGLKIQQYQFNLFKLLVLIIFIMKR